MSELATTSVLVPPIGAGPETKARSPRVTILESPRGPGLYSRTRISCDSPRHSPGLSLRRPSDRPSKETNLSPDSSSPRSRSPSLQKFDPFKRSKSPVTPAAQAALASFEVAHIPELVRAQSMARSMLARKKVKETLSAQKSTSSFRDLDRFCNATRKELLELFVEPNVPIRIRVAYPPTGHESRAGSFQMIGPPANLATLLLSFGLKPDAAAPLGVISPKCQVTLPDEIKLAVGIPLAATHFAFLYPLRQFKDMNVSTGMNLSEEIWCFALILGGFAYFAHDGEILAINAMTIVPSAVVLPFIGPYAVSARSSLSLMKHKRLTHVTVHGLLDVGFKRLAWVHPGEQLDVEHPSTEDEHHGGHPHGGFVYEMSDGRVVLFSLVANVGALKEDEINRNGAFVKAFISVRKLFVDSVDHHEMLKANRFLFRRLLRELGKLTVILGIYFGVSCAFFCPVQKWTALEAIYFASVTASTVGYGDLVPTEYWAARAITIVMIFVGVLVILPSLSAVMTLALKQLSYEKWVRKLTRAASSLSSSLFRRKAPILVRQEKSVQDLLAGIPARGKPKPKLKPKLARSPASSTNKLRLPPRSPHDEEKGTPIKPKLVRRPTLEEKEKAMRFDATGRALLESSWRFYPKNLAPSLFLNVVLQLCSAYFFVLVEKWDYGTALYHCLVTAATVGYGDVRINTTEGRSWAIVHVLLSCALLGSTIEIFDDLRLERIKESKMVAALNQQLTPTLLKRIEIHSAALRPDVRRDAAGVTELEFVISMAIELGMVDLKQLQPFIEQFRFLDVQGDGRVGMTDLNALVALNEAIRKGSGADSFKMMSDLLLKKKHQKEGDLTWCSASSTRGKRGYAQEGHWGKKVAAHLGSTGLRAPPPKKADKVLFGSSLVAMWRARRNRRVRENHRESTSSKVHPGPTASPGPLPSPTSSSRNLLPRFNISPTSSSRNLLPRFNISPTSSSRNLVHSPSVHPQVPPLFPPVIPLVDPAEDSAEGVGIAPHVPALSIPACRPSDAAIGGGPWGQTSKRWSPTLSRETSEPSPRPVTSARVVTVGSPTPMPSPAVAVAPAVEGLDDGHAYVRVPLALPARSPLAPEAAHSAGHAQPSVRNSMCEGQTRRHADEATPLPETSPRWAQVSPRRSAEEVTRELPREPPEDTVLNLGAESASSNELDGSVARAPVPVQDM